MKFNSCKKEERKTSTVCDLHDRNQILNGKMKPLLVGNNILGGT